MITICYLGESEDTAKKLKDIIAEEKIFLNVDFRFCQSTNELTEAVKEGDRCDVIFLETATDCIETGKWVIETFPQSLLVFVSDSDRYALQAYDCNAFRYLLKSDSRERYVSVLTDVHRAYTASRQNYIIDCRKGPVCVKVSDIKYVEYQNKHTFFHTLQQNYSVRRPISCVMEELTDIGFVHVHQGFGINMRWIHRIMRDEVILTDGTSVMMSVRKRGEVVSRYSDYMKKYIPQIAIASCNSYQKRNNLK